MVRTQVYLTEAQRDELAALAQATGTKQSELIRDAVDLLIGQRSGARRNMVLARAAGMWKDRKDLPDLKALRRQWDRG